jgi:hypothetical protein
LLEIYNEKIQVSGKRKREQWTAQTVTKANGALQRSIHMPYALRFSHPWLPPRFLLVLFLFLRICSARRVVY